MNLARVAKALMVLASLFAAATLVLGFMLYRATRPIELQHLTDDQRVRLLQQATHVAPPLYEPHLGVPPPGFYRLRPNTLYDRRHPAAGPRGVMGDVFTTNELGFRSVPLTAKTPGRRRLVVVGDSWTFGPGVRFDEVFTQHLQRLLDRAGPTWEVVNFGIVGWNTTNELAALRVFLPLLKPDAVVICPTSNDIDDSYEVWNGYLAQSGFLSGSIFRHSYEYERRWTESFRQLQGATDFLRGQGIASFVYFLAEWRGLAPYYAHKAGFTTAYAVVPAPYFEEPYRLPPDVDVGQHATVEGHRLIGSHLYNALLKAGIVQTGEPVALGHAVEFPGKGYSQAAVDREFAFWRRYIRTPQLVGGEGELMRRESMVSLPASSDVTTVVTELQLLDQPGLYPLRVRIEIPSPEGVIREQAFERYVPGPHRIEISKPRSLDRYEFVEVRVRADRVVSVSGSMIPVSMKKPKISLR